MCVGKCSRIVGPCLLVLGTLSMAANILLLFPSGTWKYLVEGHISKHTKVLPGVWGGGIMVLLAATHVTAVGWRCTGCSDCGTRHNAFISAVLSKLAVLGAAACFVFSGLGLTDGPLCFYNASKHGHGHGTLWGYPFRDAKNYLFDRRVWSICLEPKGAVVWNGILFFLLLLISAAEMVLASLQVLNGCLGCLCGYCEGK
uniref:Transmembrane 4 L six family member 19 n=1 Tax=Athene cunicularia TaxID=194338 RepID=A0A663LUB5_ATHCN